MRTDFEIRPKTTSKPKAETSNRTRTRNSDLHFLISDLRCRIRPISTLLLSLLLSACTVGPNYKKPTAPTPPAFKEPPPSNFKENGQWKTATPQDDKVRGDWWQMFGDPLLNDLEAQVNVSNQNIAAAEAQFRVARAAVRVARSGLFPTLSVGAGATTAGGSGGRTVVGAGNTIRSGGGTFYSLPFDFSYELDVWGSVRRGIEAAAANAQASAAD